MSDELQELQTIADSIERGDDGIVVPEEMLIEPDNEAPPINKSLYAQILTMTIGEKLKLALRGNRDARGLLIRETNRLVARFVLKNPRLTEDEVAGIARNRNIDSEILREIGDHRLWPRNAQVRLGLVTNPKTPVAIALRYVVSIGERDLRHLAKSKNVPAAIASQARRLLAQRGKI
ncbi:MAG TPA: hypothetical protein VMT89_19285 [Candidatus Acidoferrales bacterium]|nr:hypothetical protein [Candidatus Acidoferrales bacterium]